VVSDPRRGEVWWAEMADRRRPVLVLTRDGAIGVLRTLLVAPITRRVRGIPTEVSLDRSDGLPVDCAATLDNVTVADKALLVERVSQLSSARMVEVCRALVVATGC